MVLQSTPTRRLRASSLHIVRWERQDYTLTGRRPTDTVYALIVVSSVRKVSADRDDQIYMVDKVDTQIIRSDTFQQIRKLLRRLATFAMTSPGAGSANTPPRWDEGGQFPLFEEELGGILGMKWRN